MEKPVHLRFEHLQKPNKKSQLEQPPTKHGKYKPGEDRTKIGKHASLYGNMDQDVKRSQKT